MDMAGKRGSWSAKTPTEAQIIRALARTRHAVDPRTGSIIFVGGAKSGNKDPFSGAFLAGIEERSELVRRLRLIEPRDRMLLFLWYVEGLPVTTIAQRLGISRVHCYRLRKRAFQQMTTLGVPDASTPFTKSAV
jgi:DNA-directed RNA polymerase specialized sigma24 family protein